MKVLIQCGDHYENQRRILPLAVHLKNRGYEPMILVYSEDEGNIFKCLGIHVVYLKKKKIKRNPVTAGDYKGINLSSVSECDRLKQPWRFWPGRIKSYYSQLQLYIDSVLDVLDSVKPDFIFVWNGYTGFCANILREFCNSRVIKHAFLERGLLKDSLFVDTKGVNGFSSLADLALNSEYKKIANATVSASPKTLFMPLQVQSDTNILYHSPHIKTMRHFVLVVADACEKLGHKLIVRKHPEEVENDLNLPYMDCIEYCNSGSIKEWVNKTDLTVTINSTVGLEAIFEGKPVLSFGKSIYSNKQLDVSVSPLDVFDVLSRESSFSLLSKNIYNDFYFYLVNNHTCSIENFPSILSGAFPVLGEKNKFGFYSENVPKALMEKARKFKKIVVFVDLTYKDKLNLTYRKNEQEISLDYIKKTVQNKFNGKINRKWITVHKMDEKIRDEKSVYILVSKSKSECLDYDIVFDKYFNILSDHSSCS